jgi:hypothetical protein
MTITEEIFRAYDIRGVVETRHLPPKPCHKIRKPWLSVVMAAFPARNLRNA